ncbi:MAG: lipopolysaccharide kinase InaA family protein [Prevotella sp.]|jgi:tRNA A-37 threonylcarbamoyl transferase component Bud32
MTTELLTAQEYEHYDAELRDIPRRFLQSKGEMLHNGRNQICRFTLSDGKKIVVKRFKHPDFFHSFWYGFIAPNKARRSFDHATELRHRGIDTPHEIACIEERHGRWLREAYYVCEYTNEGYLTDFITEQSNFNHEAIESFARFVALLHEKGIIHKDLNNGNVTYRLSDGHYHFGLIDLNRMTFYADGKLPSRRECLKNLTLFCDDTPLFRAFLSAYIAARHWSADTFDEALKVKAAHDRHWRRKKAVKRWLKS